jgi:hypothetical protein
MDETLQELELQQLIKEKELAMIRSKIAAYQIKFGNEKQIIELDKKIAAKQLEISGAKEEAKP